MFCFSKTFLDSSTPPNVKRIYVKGYKFIKADNPSDSKKDCAFIYYKELLAVSSVEAKNLKNKLKTKCDICGSTLRLPSQHKMNLTFFG